MAIFSCRGSLQPPDPNIPEPNGVAVILQYKWPFERGALKFGGSRRVAFHRNMILNEYAVVKHGERTRFDFAIRSRLRGVKDDVVGLPLARLARRIHQWCIVSVERARLAVGVSLVVVGIEHL